MSDKQLLHLTIARVDGPVFAGDVVGVQIPGIDGSMTILAHHKPLITPLKEGTLTITKEDGSKEDHDVESGTLEISNNHATILI